VVLGTPHDNRPATNTENTSPAKPRHPHTPPSGSFMHTIVAPYLFTRPQDPTASEPTITTRPTRPTPNTRRETNRPLHPTLPGQPKSNNPKPHPAAHGLANPSQLRKHLATNKSSRTRSLYMSRTGVDGGWVSSFSLS
jgi:hypothetical protein